MNATTARTADLPALVAHLAERLRARGERMVTAESCTGGLIAAACTDLAGSSDWFERGYVTYSNAAKSDALGVPAALIDAHGAVSEPVARAMAEGALAAAAPAAQWAVAVTGVAGPGGGSAAKPVGTVWFGWAGRAPAGTCGDASPAAAMVSHTEVCRFDGDRAAVRQATVAHALARLLALIEAAGAGT